jgi:predicted amidohydrolase
LSVRIALAQLAASPDRAANLARILETMTAASQAGAELIAFP